MKRVFNIAYSLIAMAFATNVNAQQIMPPAYNSGIKINYVRAWTATAPIDNTDTLLTRPGKDVMQATQYFDGLGRPVQTVIKKGSLVTGDTAKDMVSAMVYDAFGREKYKYLPFVANNTGSNTSISDGHFKLNPFQQDSTFNKAQFATETYYYSQTNFESSPLSRALEQFAPGNNWVGTQSQGSENNRHSIKVKAWLNTATDSVRIWNVTNVTGGLGTYASSGTYTANELFKNITVDEHNSQVIEFKDKQGQVILKKVQLTAASDTGTGKGHTGWLCTYYIYDDLGQLRCVVQPKGVELLAANSWSMSYSSGVILNEQCFRYEYDGRNRMIMKKVPGAGIVYMIYDTRDRLVMSQDSVMRADYKWMYTLYDALNRDTTTGLITDNAHYNDAAYHRAQAESSTAYPNPGSYTNEVLTKKFYDNYAWRGWEGNPLSATRNSSYDSYFSSASNTIWPYPQDATTQSSLVMGMVTGTKTKILGTSSDYLYSIPFYDDKGRVIQAQSANLTTGTDISNVQYSWSGQPLINITKQEKAGTNAQTSIALSKMTYDDLWRPLKTEKKISTTKVNSGSMPGTWTTLSENEYDALGQLKKKKLGATVLDSLQYEYNIRGWMLGMNRSYVTDTANTSHWFGFDLGYDKTSLTVNGTSHNYAAAQYNGNINGMLWRSTGDDMLRKYDFTYDAANRFLSADFSQLNSNSFSKAAGVNFSVSGMSYDANGNILNMNQKGWKLGGSITIDSLAYVYSSNSNRLLKVTDAVSTDNKLGDFNDKGSTGDDYSYDGNGNLVVDKNKSLADYSGIIVAPGISYNHLNLPKLILVDGKGTIAYTYDATGNKLKKTVTDTHKPGITTITTTTYLGGIVYLNDTLQFIGHEEGRARINTDSSAVVYDYMIKDHLGNVRMLLTSQKDTAFYPAATMETATATLEEDYYIGLPDTRVDLPAGYPTVSGNAKVAQVDDKGGPVLGPAMILKVMAGDKFNVTVDSWYNSYGDSPEPSNGSPITGLISALAGGITSAGGKGTQTEIVNSGVLSPGVTEFLTNQSPASGRPKAYLNWILFDEQFNYVSSNSGFQQVPAESAYNNGSYPGNNTYPIAQNDLPVNKNGFLYIYVSNETPNIAVFFDNLQVTHIKGPLVEETHYYPFGLTMAGISSKAAGGIQNKEKTFQGQRFDDELGLNWIQFKWRNHDPQIGRFIEIDPLSDKYVYNSTYAFSENKVTNDVELEGLESVSTTLLWPIFKWFSPSPEPKKVEAPTNSQSSYFTMESFHAANSILMDAATLYVLPGGEGEAEETGVTGSNGNKGAAFEQKVVTNLVKEGHTNIAEQVSIKASNGVTTRLDAVSKNVGGKIVLTEAKSSSTAPLTENQKAAIPSIAQTGGVVVGKGKPGYPGGTVIPPTQTSIVRPKIVIKTVERAVPPVVLHPKKKD